jgi:PTS system fructose-specific IIC component/PTS system nitrogen regulatory IIA component
MSTGIKRGIAIPHAKTPFTRGVIGVLGISKSGIDYESLDGEPVHLLFLLVSSEADAATHLSVLKRIALLVEKAEFYSEMLSVRDAEHANEVIGRFEASILPHDC